MAKPHRFDTEQRFDRRFEIVAFPELPTATGCQSFAIDVPRREGVDRWVGFVHVLERLKGRVRMVRIADTADKIRPLCTPRHWVLFGRMGERPGVLARSGETLLFTFELEGPLHFVGGVNFAPQGAGWFDMPKAGA